ncbi:MAG: von Willebrand factor type A domain-containing protein, partial [Cyclobacteriaceae bacterium]
MILGFTGLFGTSSIYVTGTVYDESRAIVAGVSVMEKGTTNEVFTDVNGFYSIRVSGENAKLIFQATGYEKGTVKVGSQKVIDVKLKTAIMPLEEIAMDMDMAEEVVLTKRDKTSHSRAYFRGTGAVARSMAVPEYEPNWNTEEYSTIHENGFKKVTDDPLSTFSIDVDAASYSNMRRFINNGQLPPKDAVRIEEMINYFGYNYEQPTGNDPFSINTEVARAPWNDEHILVQVGLQGKKLAMENLPPSNIVFLLDVSGSMNAPNKLPLLKSSLKMLANELRPQDKVSIVVYAGAAGLVLEPTDGDNKQKIMEALDRLEAGGSTAGGAGINLAYETAKKNFVKGGNNRVILATDGDFNIGASSNAAMERLIEEKRQEGVFLTVLGFGMGNYKDSKMEILADKGNGNYAYIDTMKEAKKV